MAGQRHADDGIQAAGRGHALKRRGLMAGAAALVAGIAAQRASQPVGATSGGGPDGPLVMGSNFGSGGSPNTLSRLTVQVPTSTWSGSTAAMFGVDAIVAGNAPADTTALYAVGKGGGAGLLGATGITPANVTALNAGVYGLGSVGKNGVVGQSDDATGIGVKGISVSGFPIIGGVTGTGSANNTNAGVLGIGTAGPGVQGQSTGGHGLVGTTSATDGVHIGLVGYVQPGSNAIAVRGTVASGAVGYAGIFDGDVLVNGALRVFGSPKNAAAKHPGDGTYRLLYCEESPESWFADYGAGTLVNGRADVKLDADFAALVHADTYHVFLTPEGDCNGLFVTGKTPAGFAVREMKGGTSDIPFSYRVVAKRKDIVGERLAKVAPPPPLKPVTPFAVPETPAPKPPATRPSGKGADTMPGGGTP